jgi:hypothetical protein
VLTPRQLERFRRDGFVAVRGAVAPEVVADCREQVWAQLRALGYDGRDRTTWTEPLVRVWSATGSAFATAARSPVLVEAYDQLVGPRAWVRHRGFDGTVPVRFPHRRRPVDAVWHLDAGYAVRREPRLNVRSRGAALQALVLLSRTGPDDAPTRLLVGSHLDVPAVLRPARVKGVSMWDVMSALPRATFRRPVALATGQAGDVFLLHPFLVHATSWPNRGRRPRIVVQPKIGLREPFRLDRSRRTIRPVEQAILDALDVSTAAPARRR